MMVGVQCKGCRMLVDGKCTRIGNRTSEVGVCWMEVGEGEY